MRTALKRPLRREWLWETAGCSNIRRKAYGRHHASQGNHAYQGATLYTTTPQQALSVAVDTMAEFDVGSLVVMDAGRMVGMLTFHQVLKAFKNHRGNLGVTVGAVMVPDPVTALPSMETNDLRRLMVNSHSRYLPIMDGDTLLGVIFLTWPRRFSKSRISRTRCSRTTSRTGPTRPRAERFSGCSSRSVWFSASAGRPAGGVVLAGNRPAPGVGRRFPGLGRGGRAAGRLVDRHGKLASILAIWHPDVRQHLR